MLRMRSASLKSISSWKSADCTETLQILLSQAVDPTDEDLTINLLRPNKTQIPK